jgi:DDE superfamily endonuclease
MLGDPKASHLVYVDESGMDERDDYGYGYAPVGERYYDLKSGQRQGRINMIAWVSRGSTHCPVYGRGVL